MYQPIKLSPKSEVAIMENFSLDPIEKQVNVFTEAVFKDGKSVIKPIEEQFQVIKDLLDAQLESHPKSAKTSSRFDPEKFIKHLAWKELEDRMAKIFGFRNVDILHWNENYRSKTKDFETMELNCYTWPTWRYPIDGLVTDKGFFDSTKSINTQISYSLGIIKELSAAELTAIFLHELGHNLDPALVDISYTKTNVLSKYLTDRDGKINNQEKKVIDNFKSGKVGLIVEMILIYCGALALTAIIFMIIDFIESLFFNKEKAMAQIKKAIKNDEDNFTRQENQEAFADNFARMYGYGPQLISAFAKMKGYYDKKLDSRYTRERARQKVVADIVLWSLKGVHKTDMHRAHNLIREYEADLKDPNIPAKVKDGIREDLDELNKIIDGYLNSSDKFSNQLNKMILDELKKMDPSIVEESPDNKKKDDKAAFTTESALFAECIEPYDEKMSLVDEKSLRPLNLQEMLIVKQRFGNPKNCSFMKDKNGYFAYNSKARTGFYPTLEDMPESKVNFVCSVGRAM